jgi:hypothetical protein
VFARAVRLEWRPATAQGDQWLWHPGIARGDQSLWLPGIARACDRFTPAIVRAIGRSFGPAITAIGIARTAGDPAAPLRRAQRSASSAPPPRPLTMVDRRSPVCAGTSRTQAVRAASGTYAPIDQRRLEYWRARQTPGPFRLTAHLQASAVLPLGANRCSFLMARTHDVYA